MQATLDVLEAEQQRRNDITKTDEVAPDAAKNANRQRKKLNPNNPRQMQKLIDQGLIRLPPNPNPNNEPNPNPNL